MTAPLGIGALVLVHSGEEPEYDWAGEPIGVIVADGRTQIVQYPGIGLSRRPQWLVAFDPPAFTRDGRGPIERASIPADLLEPLPVESSDP